MGAGEHNSLQVLLLRNKIDTSYMTKSSNDDPGHHHGCTSVVMFPRDMITNTESIARLIRASNREHIINAAGPSGRSLYLYKGHA